MASGYDEAVSLIRGAPRNGGRLNLSNLGLTALPAEIGGLTRLSRLNLSGNALTDLPAEIGNLTRLIRLNLAGNALSTLPAEIGNLTSLTRLNLAGNPLTALPAEIGNLIRLSKLNLADNALSTLPAEIGNLTSLTWLYLAGSALTSLPAEIGNLARLSWLNLAGSALTSLPAEIGSLTSLTRLYLAGSAVTALPAEIGNLDSLTRLNLTANALRTPPTEICAAGTRSVLTFLRELGRDRQDQWASKLLIVGEAAVGKTSVYKALCGLPYDPGEPQTHGVHVDTLTLAHPDRDDVTMRLGVWDFGGQLEYRATQRFYLSDRSLFLLVWNARSGPDETGGRVDAWLEAITSAAPNSQIIIVATHCAGSVDTLDEQALRGRYRQIAAVHRVDTDTHRDGGAIGIAQLRGQIAAQAAALPLMGTPWPGSWARAAGSLTAEPANYVSWHRAEEIMRQAGVEAPRSRQVLAAALHDRGQILHFAHDSQLQDTVVLRPAWLDSMITKILDSQPVVDRGGLLSRAQRADLWADLDVGLDDKLTAMMDRFDLAYRIDRPSHQDVALVVEHLRRDAPLAMPEEWDRALDAPGAAEVRITFRLERRLAGIPSWFIAREHRYTTGTAWARGVLLRHHDGATDAWALLTDDGQPRPTIRLAVRGIDPHAFRSILIEGFTSILTERYPGTTLTKTLPCPHELGCTHEFGYDFANRQSHAGRDVQCQVSGEMINPRTLLYGLTVPSEQAALARLEHAVGGVAATTARIEGTVLQVLDTVRDLMDQRAAQGAYAPGIFTLTKTSWQHYQLRLFCEQPDAPHALPDDAGVYELKVIPDWLRAYAPFLRVTLTALRIGLPLIAPALTGIFGQSVTQTTQANLELSCKLLDDLKIPDGPGLNFAHLSAGLTRLDPNLGGLLLRELPESRKVVFLCRRHAHAYHYPAQLPEP